MPHRLFTKGLAMSFDYRGCTEEDVNKVEKFFVQENGETKVALPIRFNVVKPKDDEGNTRDQTSDAAANMRYAQSLGLEQLTITERPRAGRAIICGGAPSIKDNLEVIRKLASDKDNMVFALNWTHTWLINNGIIPDATVFFEIDVEPASVLKVANKAVTYYICSHCHRETFDALKEYKRVLWHSPPNSPSESEVREEFFKDTVTVGGGITTFLRTISIALALGYRNIELFGVDSSFPEDHGSTHVDGYETANDVNTDAFWVYAKSDTGEIRSYKTVGYLALQVEEFKEFCRLNHNVFSLRVHGDGLLPFVHRVMYADQYV